METFSHIWSFISHCLAPTLHQPIPGAHVAKKEHNIDLAIYEPRRQGRQTCGFWSTGTKNKSCEVLWRGQVNNSSWKRLQQASWRSNTCEEKRELGIIFLNKPIVLASMLTKLLPGLEIAGTSSWVYVTCYITSVLEKKIILGSCDMQQALACVLELQRKKGRMR